MRTGTKSLLFGVHQVFLHPFFVAWAWKKIYGFPWDPRLWLTFIIHDWGYWGKEKMDDREGERHVEFAAHVMKHFDDPMAKSEMRFYWFYLCFFHSRSYCERYGGKPSQLCYADKLAIALYPNWLYILLGKLSGEIYEYMEEGKEGKYKDRPGQDSDDPVEWLNAVKEYSRHWVEQNQEPKDERNKRRLYATTS